MTTQKMLTLISEYANIYIKQSKSKGFVNVQFDSKKKNIESVSHNATSINCACKTFLKYNTNLYCNNNYTHFAYDLINKCIIDGWEYDSDTLAGERKTYFSADIHDNFPDRKLKEFKMLSRKFLESKGFKPNDSNNWKKIIL